MVSGLMTVGTGLAQQVLEAEGVHLVAIRARAVAGGAPRSSPARARIGSERRTPRSADLGSSGRSSPRRVDQPARGDHLVGVQDQVGEQDPAFGPPRGSGPSSPVTSSGPRTAKRTGRRYALSPAAGTPCRVTPSRTSSMRAGRFRPVSSLVRGPKPGGPVSEPKRPRNPTESIAADGASRRGRSGSGRKGRRR